MRADSSVRWWSQVMPLTFVRSFNRFWTTWDCWAVWSGHWPRGWGREWCPWLRFAWRAAVHSHPSERSVNAAIHPGSGGGSVVEHQAHDWKVVGSSPHRSGGRILFPRVSFLCWLLFRCLFHPCVTSVAHKGSQLFCPKSRWQVTPEHTCTLCMALNEATL